MCIFVLVSSVMLKNLSVASCVHSYPLHRTQMYYDISDQNVF